MNWLFDLVNVFSLPIIQYLEDKDKLTSLEDINWNTTHGQQIDTRGLFGLEDFASFVTTLAMQKPSTNTIDKILPHHVFQLQCIVDATTIWRGWSFDEQSGHRIKGPAATFVPTWHVKTFLGRGGANQRPGFLPVTCELREHALEHPKPVYTLFQDCPLWDLGADFESLMGLSRMAEGAEHPSKVASRFSHANSNGLWDYSPYLCDVGLVEGLRLAYSASMATRNQIIEPITFVHLHNMLKERGYLDQMTSIRVHRVAGFFRAFFKDSIFPKGEIPKFKFARCFQGLLDTSKIPSIDGYDVGDLSNLSMFRTKSQLVLYQEASWDPSRIPEKLLDPWSAIGIVRLDQARRFNPATGEVQFEETELVRTALNKGMSDEWLGVSVTFDEGMEIAEECRVLFKPKMLANPKGQEDNSTDWGYLEIFLEDLEAAKIDISNDVVGCRALSGFNYTEIAWTLMNMFQKIEDELDEQGGLDWRCSGCSHDSQASAAHNRLHLARSVMDSDQDNKERLSVFAKHFEYAFSDLTDYM
ncbi:hypothetical protein CSAL01_07208 [Colletotrichum salicis]|uniref:Uncharacterized protein n=1 Tax=Colletotrichum salicis TaxID=1209931 RepID=A0A135UKJ2_9PEZI|nr:hypothetical protein CSAL01_07208 [Colletotrichum salicis]